MKRDMDLIRSIVLEIEDGKEHFETISDDMASKIGVDATGMTAEDADRMEYHITLLQDAGFAEFTGIGEGWVVDRLTWKGHDFADSVRDDEIWRMTKEGALAVKGFSVDLLLDLAKGLIRKQIETRTGIDL